MALGKGVTLVKMLRLVILAGTRACRLCEVCAQQYPKRKNVNQSAREQ